MNSRRRVFLPLRKRDRCRWKSVQAQVSVFDRATKWKIVSHEHDRVLLTCSNLTQMGSIAICLQQRYISRRVQAAVLAAAATSQRLRLVRLRQCLTGVFHGNLIQISHKIYSAGMRHFHAARRRRTIMVLPILSSLDKFHRRLLDFQSRDYFEPNFGVGCSSESRLHSTSKRKLR